MAYTLAQLIMDVLPRVGNMEPTGVTIAGAANSVTSMINKILLTRKSDLLATGQFAAVIPAGGYSIQQPADFISFSERPSVTVPSDLISGITTQLSADGLGAGQVDSINALFSNQTGVLVSDIQALVTPTLPNVSVQPIIDNLSDGNSHRHMDPVYLDDDTDDYDYSWWENGEYGNTYYSGPGTRPRSYKVIGGTIFIRPKLSQDAFIKGRYNQLAVKVSAPTDNLQYAHFFEEVYREGVVWIISKGVAMPDIDPAFSGFIDREVNSVVNSRISVQAQYRRVKRSAWT